MHITKLFENGSLQDQLFFGLSHGFHQLHYEQRHIVKNEAQSLVALIEDQNLVLKCIKPRSFHEFGKLLWGHSRISKEISGNKKLSSLNIKVPEIHSSYYGLIPTFNYAYIGCIVMQNLSTIGFKDAFDLIRFELVDAEVQSKIISNIYNDVSVMLNNGILFSDLKLNNVFANEKGDIAWIDTGVRVLPTNKSKAKKKIQHSIDRFIRMYGAHLSSSDQIQLRNLYK